MSVRHFLRSTHRARAVGVYPVSTVTGLRSLLSLSAQPRLPGGKLTRTAGPLGPRTGSGAAELRIASVFPCVARRSDARARFKFARCCW